MEMILCGIRLLESNYKGGNNVKVFSLGFFLVPEPDSIKGLSVKREV